MLVFLFAAHHPKISPPRIPFGMHRSVETAIAPRAPASCKDASRLGCREKEVFVFSTERCNPNGLQIC